MKKYQVTSVYDTCIGPKINSTTVSANSAKEALLKEVLLGKLEESEEFLAEVIVIDDTATKFVCQEGEYEEKTIRIAVEITEPEQ